MRKFKYCIHLLFGAALALTTACQDDFDDPKIPVPVSSWLEDTSGYELRTIAQVKADFWKDDANYYLTIPAAADGRHILVKGRVISSDAAGNIYKSLIIQDATGALAMSINANSMNNRYRRGQEIVMDLTGMTIGKYSGLQQLGFPEDSPSYGQQTTFMPYEFFRLHEQMNGDPVIADLDTLTVNSYSEITGGGAETLMKWQSQLVRFNNCSFENGGTATFAAEKETVNQTLKLSDGNTINVRTSGYSNFYATTLPEGNGDVAGILSYFNNAWQLTLIDVAGCMNFGNPTVGPGAKDNPYTVDQALSIVVDGGGSVSNAWVTGYIVGAVAPGVTTISSNSDIQFAADPELDNTLVFAQTPDCTDWTKCMVVSLPQGSKLRQYGNLIDNPGNYKKQIWLLGNLAPAMGIAGVTGNSGSASEFEIEGVEVPGGDTPEPGKGDGSEANPYTVTQAIALGNPGTAAWVTGYIVGWVEGASIDTGSHFAVPSSSASNVLIAESPTVTDYKACIPVQLVAGTDIRTAVNLKDHPENLGKQLLIKGELVKYFNQPGLKSPTGYKLDGQSSEPSTGATPAGAGTEASPYNVARALQIIADGKYTSDKVYVSGVVKGAPEISTQYGNATYHIVDEGYTQQLYVFRGYYLNGEKFTATDQLKDGDKVLILGELTSYNGSPQITTGSQLVSINGSSTGGGDNPGPGPGPSDATTADFSAFGAVNSTYGTYTSSTGWVAKWCQILSGSSAPDNKTTFEIFGTDKDYAVCLNGNTAKQGTLTSPLLAGGIGTLTFDYCHPYTDSKCKLTVNILQGGKIVASDLLENNGMSKLTKYTYTHAFNVKGEFTIEIINEMPSAATGNKDRVAVWNMSWTH